MHKHYCLTLLSFFVITCSFAQKKDTVRKYLDENFAFTRRGNAAYPALAIKSGDHWLLYATYPDTSLLLTIWFKDADLTVRDGPFSLYFGKGKIWTKGYFVDNAQYGLWKYWYQNGTLKDSGMIVNGQLANTWMSWSENGLPLARGEFKIDSSIIAKPTKLGPSSSLVPVTDGLIKIRNGAWVTYHPNGNKSDSGQYLNNTKAGYWKLWYESGVIEAEGEFKNDSLVGEWKWYRENGNLSSKEFYKENKLHKLECYDEEGKYSGEFCSILKPPFPLGNFSDFQNYMMDNIQMPKELRNKELNGIIIIQCTVSQDGKLNKVIVNGPYKTLNEEVVKFFHTLTTWSPAIVHNRAVEYTIEYKLPLSPGAEE